MSAYYDRDGSPISLMEWSAGFGKGRRVAEDTVNGYWVSTVWLGLNHQYGDGPPLIFETMVFPADESGEVTDWDELYGERYSTETEAREGHKRIVALYAARSNAKGQA